MPELPAEAGEFSEAGLDATLQYFWDSYDYLRQTGDPDLVKAVTADDCDSCNRLMALWEAHYEDGKWSNGNEPTVISSSPLVAPPSTRAGLLFTLRERPSESYSQGSENLEGSAPDQGTTETSWSGAAEYDKDQRRWFIASLSTSSQ